MVNPSLVVQWLNAPSAWPGFTSNALACAVPTSLTPGTVPNANLTSLNTFKESRVVVNARVQIPKKFCLNPMPHHCSSNKFNRVSKSKFINRTKIVFCQNLVFLLQIFCNFDVCLLQERSPTKHPCPMGSAQTPFITYFFKLSFPFMLLFFLEYRAPKERFIFFKTTVIKVLKSQEIHNIFKYIKNVCELLLRGGQKKISWNWKALFWYSYDTQLFWRVFPDFPTLEKKLEVCKFIRSLISEYEPKSHPTYSQGLSCSWESWKVGNPWRILR